MSTTARKARKRAGIPLTKAQKTPTGPYKTRQERYEDRVMDRQAESTMRGIVGGVTRALSNARRAVSR